MRVQLPTARTTPSPTLSSVRHDDPGSSGQAAFLEMRGTCRQALRPRLGSGILHASREGGGSERGPASTSTRRRAPWRARKSVRIRSESSTTRRRRSSIATAWAVRRRDGVFLLRRRKSSALNALCANVAHAGARGTVRQRAAQPDVPVITNATTSYRNHGNAGRGGAFARSPPSGGSEPFSLTSVVVSLDILPAVESAGFRSCPGSSQGPCRAIEQSARVWQD